MIFSPFTLFPALLFRPITGAWWTRATEGREESRPGRRECLCHVLARQCFSSWCGYFVLPDEGQQLFVHLVFQRRTHSMRSPRINLENGAFYDFGRQKRRGANRHDLIVIAVK